MPKAVRFDQYGGLDVLKVVEVPQPQPGEGQVLIQVKAASINPGEAKIREGELAKQFPSTFPSGEGSDLAGVVTATGPGVSQFQPGDEVLGWTDGRASHAQYVVTETAKLTAKPPALSWEAAGSLYVAGGTAWTLVGRVDASVGDTVVVAGASGGVGSIAAQLASRTGAIVIGLASEHSHDWLRDHGVTPVAYGDGVADRIREAAPGGKVDALIDTVGDDYVQLALDLGVLPSRVDTIVSFDAGDKFGVHVEHNAAGSNVSPLTELAVLIIEGEIEVPIAATYPLDQVQDAYRRLGQGHLLGKIVLIP
jgi:NADPH:quinone reductase-like Zn-dependent oxidoreductase